MGKRTRLLLYTNILYFFKQNAGGFTGEIYMKNTKNFFVHKHKFIKTALHSNSDGSVLAFL